MTWIRPFGVGLVVLLALDFVWLGLLMSGFYRRGLGQLARTTADGTLSPIWLAAVPVYLLIVAGLLLFALARPTADSVAGAAVSGALFGLIAYGIYDFTNLSTLRGYAPQLAVVDTLWGGFLCAMTAAAMRWATP